MGHLKKFMMYFLLELIMTCNSCFEDVDLTGLLYSPDPVNERVKQSLSWKQTLQSRDMLINDRDYSFLIAGDTQVGGIINLDTLIARASRHGISGLSIVGDLTTGQKEDYSILNNELKKLNNIPAFLILGNHDLFFNGWDTYYSYFGSSTYAFTVKTNDASDLYICLNSGNATIGSRQLAWLQNQLDEKRNKHRFCIIFSHVNFFSERHTFSASPLVDELHVLLALFYKHSVDTVITGHDHYRSEETFGKTHYITLDAFYDGFEEASYLKLDIKNGELTSNFEAL
jgi:predicted phosphodiesterase